MVVPVPEVPVVPELPAGTLVDELVGVEPEVLDEPDVVAGEPEEPETAVDDVDVDVDVDVEVEELGEGISKVMVVARGLAGSPEAGVRVTVRVTLVPVGG